MNLTFSKKSLNCLFVCSLKMLEDHVISAKFCKTFGQKTGNKTFKYTYMPQNRFIIVSKGFNCGYMTLAVVYSLGNLKLCEPVDCILGRFPAFGITFQANFKVTFSCPCRPFPSSQK